MLEFSVNNQIISRKDDFRVVADSRNYLMARFTFSEEWQGDAVAVFGGGGGFYHAVLCDNQCKVPFEVIKSPGFSVSVFCGGDTLITANALWVDVEYSGFCQGEEPSTPTPDIWQQYVEQMGALIEKGLPYIGENGNWFLYDTASKAYCDTGTVALGYTPKKGVDYWTEADKAEMVDAVLSALPDADTMSFPLEETVSEVSEE